MDAAGQLTVTVSVRETVQLRIRLLQQALARPQDGPQLLRVASLSGPLLSQDLRGIGDEVPALKSWIPSNRGT